MKINTHVMIWASVLIGASFLTSIIAPTTIGKALLLALITVASGVGCSIFANYLDHLSSQEEQSKMNYEKSNADKEPNNSVNISNTGSAGRDIEQTAGSKTFSFALNLGISLTIITCVVIVGLAFIKPNVVTEFFNKELPRPENTNITR